MTTITLTDEHKTAAYIMGGHRARAERTLEVPGPNLELDESDIADIAYTVTGYKLDVESDEAQTLALEYSEGYDDVWGWD